MHGARVAQAGCPAEPLEGLSAVLFHAASMCEQVRIVVDRPVQATICGASVPGRGQRVVNGSAPAIFVATAKHVHCHRYMLVRRMLKPVPRLIGVARDTRAVKVYLPKQRLRQPVARTRGHEQTRGGCGRIVLQQLTDKLGFQCFPAHWKWKFAESRAERPGAILA
jgi:hypothetical protein